MNLCGSHCDVQGLTISIPSYLFLIFLFLIFEFFVIYITNIVTDVNNC